LRALSENYWPDDPLAAEHGAGEAAEGPFLVMTGRTL
jgi:hypothetical protein